MVKNVLITKYYTIDQSVTFIQYSPLTVLQLDMCWVCIHTFCLSDSESFVDIDASVCDVLEASAGVPPLKHILIFVSDITLVQSFIYKYRILQYVQSDFWSYILNTEYSI